MHHLQQGSQHMRSLSRFMAVRSMVAIFMMFGMCIMGVHKNVYALETQAKHAILMDYETGQVLFSHDADTQMVPSSMSKLMTLYIAFDRLKNGSLKPDDELPVSKKAWKMGGSKMFVEVGKTIAVKDLLQGVAVQSGNDACIVLAEGISGSEEAFAEEMNRVASALGLTSSHFVNATGWPDEGHYMSARDLALLARHIIEQFPEYYPLFSQKEFTFSGIRQPNRNMLLYRDSGVDGMKTGHTEAAGYGLTASAKQEDRRMIVVVNGMESEKARANEAERLLLAGFRDYEVLSPFRRGDVIGRAPVWMGELKEVPITLPRDVNLLVPRTRKEDISMEIHLEGPVAAPVQQGDKIAELHIDVPGQEPRIIALEAGVAVQPLAGVSRIWPAFRHLVLGM